MAPSLSMRVKRPNAIYARLADDNDGSEVELPIYPYPHPTWAHGVKA